MNRLLQQDSDSFDKRFPLARPFLIAAHLRYEALCIINKAGCGIATGWELERLEELKDCPACQVEWFKELIKR